jgi:hypothetical protein
MKLDKALSVIRSMGSTKRRYRRPPRTLTYQPPAPQRRWTWETATPQQRACFVREHRKLGIMDWDLCELFGLTRDGLAEIVKGKDWAPHHHLGLGQSPPHPSGG